MSQDSRHGGVNKNTPTILILEDEIGDRESAISTRCDSNMEDHGLVPEGQSATTNDQEAKRNEFARESKNGESAIPILRGVEMRKYHPKRKCRHRR